MKPASLKNRNVAVAIIGMAARFPGASNVAKYWQNLCDGIESLSVASDEELLAAGVPSELLKNPAYVRAGGVVEGADLFDPSFFGFGAREAEIIDPQQRVFLECAWEALEDAGCDPRVHKFPVGVFAGAGMNTYGAVNLYSNPELIRSVGPYQMMLGNDKDFLATRVAYKLNLKGPAITVQTACSTSLVAVQMAFESLLRGECETALAGGVSIQFPQNSGYLFMPGMILSPDGHCRTFDAEAAGTVPGRGAAVVVLKLLEDAVRDGDRIYAVIRGAAINNDGAAKVGYSAPSIEGQSDVIRKSIEMAGFAPESIRYIEAHGTGTEVGDPIEVAALTEAFGDCAGLTQFCGLGSVKPNIGHLDTAAGVAGLIKAALTLHYRLIPPTIHFKRPNPHIDFAQTPFFVNSQLSTYEGADTFRAGVSSFGIGGTNAHVSLEEWREPARRNDPSSHLILLSARSAPALAEQARTLARHMELGPCADLSEIAYTLQVGRHFFSHRRFLIASTAEDLKRQLNLPRPTPDHEGITGEQRRSVAFLFSGQGSQYINMGLGLYKTSTFFRQQIDQCCEILEPHLDLDLRTILYPTPGEEAAAQSLLNETWLTQPALFAVEYATAQLWMALGIEPAAMVGHSVGEYVAACLAGVFSLQDALALITERGRLIQSLPTGSMLAISLAESEVIRLLPQGISIAATNSRSNTVVSGTSELIDTLETDLQAKKISSRRLRTSHAFHSEMMDAAMAPFFAAVSKFQLNAPTIPYVSNLTGNWITSPEATNPQYWVDHLRNAVRFADCVERINESGCSLCLETGPGETLITLLRDHLGRDNAIETISSLRHPLNRIDDRNHLLNAVGRLWLSGKSLKWALLYDAGRPRKISLPTYPFERQRFWIDAQDPKKQYVASEDTSLQRNPDISDWFYVPSWKRISPPAKNPRQPLTGGNVCLLFAGPETPVTPELLKATLCFGRTVLASPGSRFHRLSTDEYQINISERKDYTRLLNSLIEENLWPQLVVHAYALSSEFQVSLNSSLDHCLFSVSYVAQAISDISARRLLELNVLVDSAFDVLGDGHCDPKSAMMSGFCNALPIDCPNISVRLLDIDSTGAQNEIEMQLRSELALDADNSPVAWRGKTRWVQSYDRAPVPKGLPPQVQIPQHATFLITGGLGGIGLGWARYLAQTYKARFVITTRGSFPNPNEWPELIKSVKTSDSLRARLLGIESIQSLGGEVLIITADSSSASQMQKAVQTTFTKFGSLFGIIHAAGIAGAGMLQGKSRADAMVVIEPKVQGTEWILPLLNQRDLGLVILCSSINAVVPSIGLTDYGAANAYLDAFALAHDKTAGTRVLSHGWDSWSESGMAVDFARRLVAAGIRPNDIVEGISDKEALEVFPRLLSYPLPNLIISTRDLPSILQYIRSIEKPAELVGKTPAIFHPRPELTTEYEEATDETEQALVAIWQELLGVDRVGTQDNFFQLGGHSLLGTQMMARIRERFGIDLPLRTVFETPTPGEMASLLRTIPWASGTATSTPTLDQEREEIEL